MVSEQISMITTSAKLATRRHMLKLFTLVRVHLSFHWTRKLILLK